MRISFPRRPARRGRGRRDLHAVAAAGPLHPRAGEHLHLDRGVRGQDRGGGRPRVRPRAGPAAAEVAAGAGAGPAAGGRHQEARLRRVAPPQARGRHPGHRGRGHHGGAGPQVECPEVSS